MPAKNEVAKVVLQKNSEPPLYEIDKNGLTSVQGRSKATV